MNPMLISHSLDPIRNTPRFVQVRDPEETKRVTGTIVAYLACGHHPSQAEGKNR